MVDKFGENSELDTILIKVASRCNINCTYCYVYNMGDDNWKRLSKFLEDDTIEGIVDSLRKLIKYQKRIFSIVLHGGEPLLLGQKKLTYLLRRLRSILPNEYPISLQTNGILISDEIMDICDANYVSIAVSIDGPEHIHDKFRVTHQNRGSFHDVLVGINKLSNHPNSVFLNAGLLSVIDPTSDPKEIYDFFKEIKPPSVDFLYRDGNLTNLPYGKSNLESVEYGVWMAGLLDVYLSDSDPLPIRIIDDMLKVLLGGNVSKEGMGMTDFGILIIDTDGTLTKNDTLKSSFNGADRFAQKVNIKDGNLIEFINSSDFHEYKQMQRPISNKCLACPVLNICGGGMILHRWSEEKGFNNPSVYCSDQTYLIEYMKSCIQKLLYV
ncbi:cyclophane-forming radical SAM/SPASM peptide maturase YhhB [Sphingobacterium siyangense]|uniref:cyclophane-forming radical SAM/SPASM peptide maturase YhhB n=1 Tax=Sphingobacterium siyangense TaxID=459529 RepID=UPI0031F7BEA8